MNDASLPPEFLTIVRSHLRMLEVGDELTRDVDMAEAGLDSLSMVSLIVELEAEFGVVLPDEELSWVTFRTPNSLWDVIANLVETR